MDCNLLMGRCALMTIHEIIINGFGNHCNVTINFRDGINIIVGNNESGKSTIAAFVRALLYGMPGSDVSKDRKKYRPWDRTAKYGGEMLFEHKGVVYKVTAEFAELNKNDSIILYNVTSNEQITIDSGKTVGEIVLEITADAYDVSSFAPQLSSKPDLKNANVDYLFDRIMKKSEENKISSFDFVAGKRIKSAIEKISSQKNPIGILEKLQQDKTQKEAAALSVETAKSEAEKLRNEYNKMQQELNEEKDKHVASKTDMSEVAHAVEVISLHNEIKKYVKEINTLDTDLAEAANKAKRTLKPINIIYVILMSICIICSVLLIVTPQLNKISFLAGICKFLNVWSKQLLPYVVLCIIAAFLTICQIVVTSLCNKKVRIIKEDLFTTEAELSDLLNLEYVYGAKHHTKNRENINEALNEHTKEYKISRSILENEDNKNKMYSEHLAVVEEYTEKIAYTKASADALNKSISKMDDIFVLEEELETINDNIKLFERRYEALLLASDVMDDAYQRWQADMGPEFGKNAGEILHELSDGKYAEVKVARDFDISVKDADGAAHRSYYYSGATIDQMYLALRLSLVKMLSSADGKLPLILDDPFVQYDSNRKIKAFTTLENFAKNNNLQIVLTTCINEPFYESANIREI